MAHVLVPMDGSPQAESALEHTINQFQAPTVTVLHSADPVEMPGEITGRPGGATEDWREQVEERVESIFEEAERIATGTDATLETERAAGPPARTIVEYAESEDVDHVVMGSHGRTGVSRVLLGSVAEKVVRRSPIPVTVVR